MRYFIIGILFLSLTGCGIFKRTNKTLDKFESSNVVKRDCVIMSNIESKEIDKGIIITETVKEQPKQKVEVSGIVKDGINIFTDSLGRQVKAQFDSITKSLGITFDIEGYREVTKVTEYKDRELNSTSSGTVSVSSESEVKIKESQLKKESKPVYSWIFYVGLTIVGFIILFKVIRRRGY